MRFLEFSLPGGAFRVADLVAEQDRVCFVLLIGAHEGLYVKAKRQGRLNEELERLRRIPLIIVDG